MTKKFIILSIIFFLIVGCGFSSAIGMHPVNQYFNSLEYPRIGLNQINTSKLRQNPYLIKDIARLDMVIINKSDDLFVDKNASTQYVSQIKALNPNVKVLQYLSISDVWDYQDTFRKWAKQHPEALLKDNTGNYVHPYGDKYGNRRFMFDSTSPVWQNYFAQRMKKITDQGMDGIFIDNTWNTNWQKLNISPEKFRQIQQGWETAMQKGRALIGPNKIIIGNSPPNPIYQTRDMAMLEGRLDPSKASFNQYMQYTKEANSYGQLIYDTVKYSAYTGGKFHYVYDFFLPVVLLTDNVWGFSSESSQWFDLVKKVGKLGKPLSCANKMNNGVWNREFTRGRVLFNDTSSPQKITLPVNTYKTVNNVPLNEIILQPMKGIVLKKS